MQKRITLVIIVAISLLNAMADTIVLKNGTTLTVYNIERGEKSLIYTETENPDAPMKKIPIEDCFAIKIGEGEMEIIGEKKTMLANSEEKSEINPGVPTLKAAIPAAVNSQLLDFYSQCKFESTNKPGKSTNHAIALWVLDKSSIIADSNLAMSFQYDHSLENGWTGPKYIRHFKIVLQNLSNQNVYIDLGSSFRIFDQIGSEPLYNNVSVSHSSKSLAGGSVNLGSVANAIGVGGAMGALVNGINLGGGKSSGMVVTEGNDRILTIPPGGQITIPAKKIVNGANVKEEYETLPINPSALLSLNIKKNECQTFDQKNTPQRHKYTICYSTSPDFMSYTNLEANIYLKKLYGTNQDFKCPNLIIDHPIQSCIYLISHKREKKSK